MKKVYFKNGATESILTFYQQQSVHFAIELFLNFGSTLCKITKLNTTNTYQKLVVVAWWHYVVKCFKTCHFFLFGKGLVATQIYRFFFHFKQLLWFFNSPDLCWHRMEHLLTRNETLYSGFLIPKIWQILKHCTRQFYQA